MITIRKSETADTRASDFARVSKATLAESSGSHIADVAQGLIYFGRMLVAAARCHDSDKLGDLDGFHRDFVTGFKTTAWWDTHRKLSRHHLQNADGVPADVNLVDVLEMITDCVMAGMARSGSVYPVEIQDAVLRRAFNNTVELLKSEVVVASGEQP